MGSMISINKMRGLRKSLALHILGALIAVVFCYIITSHICENWRNIICDQYHISKMNFSWSYMDSKLFYNDMNILMYSAAGKKLLLINWIELILLFIYILSAIIFASRLYYNHCLHEPLNILKTEAEAVKNEDLSFDCTYESQDEMNDVCDSFNNMRLKLIDNQKSIWRLMEEQKQINAAFAHDLRTPLTVMRGYIDLITTYYPDGKLSDEKMIETFAIIMVQVNRLEKFSNTMKNIHSFEEMTINKTKHSIYDLIQKSNETINGFKNDKESAISMTTQMEESRFVWIDELFYIHVLENLLSNAARFAHNKIETWIELEDMMLLLYVRDDGEGFLKEDLLLADQAYYTKNKNDLEHFGLGLTICRLLCEKHGGEIQLFNSIYGGAMVCASFDIKN